MKAITRSHRNESPKNCFCVPASPRFADLSRKPHNDVTTNSEQRTIARTTAQDSKVKFDSNEDSTTKIRHCTFCTERRPPIQRVYIVCINQEHLDTAVRSTLDQCVCRAERGQRAVRCVALRCGAVCVERVCSFVHSQISPQECKIRRAALEAIDVC